MVVGGWLFLLAAVLLPQHALAQSLSVEEAANAPAVAPVAPAAVVAPPRNVVVPPEPIAIPLGYPDGAAGEADVVLELSIDARGNVTLALAVQGVEPFASLATSAAEKWQFRAARRDGKAIASKIRFLARFTPPRDVVEPEVAPATSPAPSKKPGTPATTEITVKGEKPPPRHELARVEISRMPGAFDDAFRAIEGLPGVVPLVSGLPYFYVRGAPPGNVGYFFDGIPVPWLYHFGAGPGVFQPAFVDRVELYPGAYPARYGRYAGAIVAGEVAEPAYRTRGEWKVRLVDSGGMVEAPFANGRGAIMLGGRYSYTGLILKLIVPKTFVSYWDYQARVRYDVAKDDTVELVAFGSSDYITDTHTFSVHDPTTDRFSSEQRKVTVVDAGFHRLDLRWDHRIERGNWRNALMLGHDRTALSDGQVDVYDNLVGFRSELKKELSERVHLRAGADALLESLKQTIRDSQPGSDNILPGDLGSSLNQNDLGRFGFSAQGRRDFSLGAYAEVAWNVSPRVQVTPGVRSDVLVSDTHAKLAIDPRVNAEYQLSKKLKVTNGLALVHQGPSFIGAVPGLKPSLAGGLQSAVQYSASATYELPAGFTGTLAVFESIFENMTDYVSIVRLKKTAIDEHSRVDPLGQAPKPQIPDLRTNGYAYGAEIMLRRSLSKKLGGFVSYTLSRSQRSTGRVSGPATTDRRHVLNVAASADLGKNWRLGGRVMFYTGVPVEVGYLEVARNPPRTPAFWRLDAKLEKRWYIQRPDRWWGLSLEVLNSTLNEEVLRASCNAYTCKQDKLGPITVPSVAVEGGF